LATERYTNPRFTYLLNTEVAFLTTGHVIGFVLDCSLNELAVLSLRKINRIVTVIDKWFTCK